MTREEAINKVRWVLYGLVVDKDVRDAFEMLIPELRESEDERMMREFNDWLCEEIECRTNDLRDEKDRRTLNMLCYILTKVKTWLEKQKEQKPVEGEKYPESKTFEDEWKNFYNNHLINRQVMSKREIAKHFFWFGQKQIEKPVEWKINGNSIPTENQFVDISPVEWSEEDKEAFDMCIDAIPKAWKTKSGILLTKWLKDNIHIQSKQEWSEEDENCRNEMLQYIKQRIGDGTTGQALWKKWYNWLKRL